MVAIISQQADLSTIDVIKWLIYFKIPYVTINREDNYEINLIKIISEFDHSITIRNIQTGIIIDFSTISAYWYRRGEINLVMPCFNNQNTYINKVIIEFLNKENKKITELLYDYLGSLPRINEFRLNDLNKLIVLRKALKYGLKIPSTYITPNLDLVSFDSNSEYISKPLSDPFHIRLKKGDYTTYTEKISPKNYSNKYFSSLVQENIKKEADIRIFYLMGRFFSMAILSQSNDQTKTDFRKYSAIKPNRKLPFKLPIEIEEKLHSLMVEMKLESGSIDMILSKDMEFTFLEINPIGQFGMTSYPCNYYIEREIAHCLKSLHHSNQTINSN